MLDCNCILQPVCMDMVQHYFALCGLTARTCRFLLACCWLACLSHIVAPISLLNVSSTWQQDTSCELYCIVDRCHLEPFGNAGVHVQGTLVGNKVYLFGGEDAARRPHGDLFVLDLADMEWQSPEVTGNMSTHVQVVLPDMVSAACIWVRNVSESDACSSAWRLPNNHTHTPKCVDPKP